MFIEVGTEVSLRDLYYGLVVASGNDASVAIAEHIAGAEDAFADLMNQYAERLGMTNSHFVNAHGLPHPDHYTSARDMAILARARVLQDAEDYYAYSQREYSYNGITQRNRNELLGDENLDVDGLKTGYTRAAGYCLVASAEREGMRLVSVVMGADSRRARAAESRKLLQYGFRFYETRRLLAAGEALQQVEVWSARVETVPLGLQRDVWLTLPRGDFDDLVDRTMVDAVIRAPLEQGQAVGQVLIEYEGEPVVDQQLIVLEAVESAGLLRRLWDSIVLFFMRLLGLL
jgi:D-alanyl-D-alanine carboxypeptidase (penicillin-binding protein 5/6)